MRNALIFIKRKKIYISLFLLTSGFIQQSYTQDIHSSDIQSAFSLFSSETHLEITIKSDFKNLLKGKTGEPTYQAAELIYMSPEDVEEVFQIKIRPRGITRKLNYCFFPPLMLNFKKKEVDNTIFAGQDKLKIVSYCKNSEINEQFNIQEYLVYKVYELLTPFSFKTRLARFTYIDVGEKYKPVTRYGFLIENDDIMAARNGGTIIEMELTNQDRCDRKSIDIFTVFQFLVGNTDWWVGNQHNVKMVSVDGKMPIPVPYDFDITGVVNTNYGKPDERLGISSTRERLFRGFCRMPGEYEEILEIFKDKKEDIYELYRSCSLLDEKQLKGTLSYYDEFYEIINDPRQISAYIYDACPLNHKHLHEY